MYSVNNIQHETYGDIIEVKHSETGSHHTPFTAIQQAIKEQNTSLQLNQLARIFIDHQILTPQQAEKWAYDEYKSLPKCKSCFSILLEGVYTGGIFDSSFFCSEACSIKSQIEELKKLQEEEEIDYL